MPAGLDHTRNIGIMAHIDAGKTTLTERILYDTGISWRMGEVDDGTAVMDFLVQEQERGITINSAATTIAWRDHRVNLIDTPGHVDFTVEVERSLRVLDGAIVILSAVEGVEAQTETVWRQAERHGVPRIGFVNKLDRVGASLERVVESVRRKLHPRPVLYQLPVGEEDDLRGVVDLVDQVVLTWSGVPGKDECFDRQAIPADLRDRAGEAREALISALADGDDEIVEAFVDQGNVAASQLRSSTRSAVLAGSIFPIFCGSASRNLGVQPLLDAVVDYLPSPLDVPAVRGWHPRQLDREVVVAPDADAPFCGLAFKVAVDRHLGRIVFLRIYSGTCEPGDVLWNPRTGARERIGRIFRVHADALGELDRATAGDIVALAGLADVGTGDTLCSEARPVVLETLSFPEPVISVAVEPETANDAERLGAALARIAAEDPSFDHHRDRESGQMLLSGMGELHLEVVLDRLRRDHGVALRAGRPRVAWRETITRGARGEGLYQRQVGGRGVYGHAVLDLRPTPRGSGLVFEDRLAAGTLPRDYVEAIARGARAAAERGALVGHPMVDLRIVLVESSFHEVDSTEAAFEVAGRAAFEQALAKAAPAVLEPIMRLDVATPEEYTGAVIGDLNSRRGTIADIEGLAGSQIITAHVPLATMFGYATDLRSTTQGRATFSMHFDHYAPAPVNVTRDIVARVRGS